MASGRLAPVLIAAGAGVLGGLYIWQAPLQEVTGKSPRPQDVNDGRSQAVKDSGNKGGSSVQSPHPSLREGGASPVDPLAKTVAGASSDARKGYSADHSVKTRSNPSEQDGTSGGGVGVAEMRERKMEGRGLPSPQGGDTKARPVEAVANNGEMGGVKKQGRWWLGGW